MLLFLFLFTANIVLTLWFIPVCGMVHIKEPLLLIDKSCLCEWSLTICLTPYNRR